MVPAHTLILELCQDRVGLLVDPRSPPPSSWKAAGLKLSGLPGWLAMEDVAPLLHAATGMPITERSIAQDVIALKATGMVVSVRVLTAPPPPEANPDFFSSPEWRTVAPMGKLEYVISSKAEGGTGNGALRIDADSIRPWLSPEQAKRVQAEVGRGAGGALLPLFVSVARQLRRVLARDGLRTVPRGLCAVLRPGSVGDGVALSLEMHPGSSGVPGKAHPVALLPLWDCDAIRCPDPDAHTQAAPASAHAPRHPLGSALAGALTRAYAALQERAGRKVGIGLGEAWRAAFRAAASSGVDTVVLGDSRSRRTLVGLAAGLERAWGPVLGGAAAAAAAGGVVASAAAPEGGAGVAAVLLAVTVPLAVAAWPLVGPLAEITLLGNRSAEGIEEAVRLHTSIQDQGPGFKLWGEDALLDWPGARGPLIEERDARMAALILAALRGEGLDAPGYTRERGAEGVRWSYRDGVQSGTAHEQGGNNVVAIVGSAHVPGIMARLEEALG
ncbi:hypothetical protein ACKKBF_B36595 [Auxenochlorella protothecoides x Auxenochlorella symbiontica]